MPVFVRIYNCKIKAVFHNLDCARKCSERDYNALAN